MPPTTILLALGFFIVAHHFKVAGETSYALATFGVGLWFVWPGWPAAAYRAICHVLHGVSPESGPLIGAVALLAVTVYGCKLIFDHRR